jgi:hypothetical protein
MKVRLAVAVAGLGLLCSAVPAVAHHSFATEYDAKKPLTLKGVVTKVEWTNPHARFYIDATDEKGNVTRWNFEIASPSALSRNGWTRKTLKAGDEVTVKAFGSRSGVNIANATSVTLADGRSLFSGSAGDGAPPERQR